MRHKKQNRFVRTAALRSWPILSSHLQLIGKQCAAAVFIHSDAASAACDGRIRYAVCYFHLYVDFGVGVLKSVMPISSELR